MAVNNTPITTYGQRSLTLNLGLRRSLPWIFIIADVQNPILGADFLRRFGLLVDMKQRQLSLTFTSREFSLPTPLRVRPSVQSTLTIPTTAYCRSSQPSPKSTHQTALSCMTSLTTLRPHAPPPPSLSPSQTRTSPCSKARVRAHATAGDHTSFIQCMVLPPPHGAEEDCW